MRRLAGLLVNPIAGMGGRVGLHGSDGAQRLDEALRRGAIPVTPARALRALRRLASRPNLEGADFLAAPGTMGAEVAARSGLRARVLDVAIGPITTSADTLNVARAMAASGVELIVFAGGDGTAADVVRAVGQTVPVLGVPSGVKMRSGVFASTPEAAGDLAADFLTVADSAMSPRRLKLVDIVDAEEGGVPGDPLASVLRGVALVPDLGDHRLVGTKSSATLGSRAELDALAEAVASEVACGTLHLFGPGSTTARVLVALGIEATPLGVDAVVNGEVVGKDLSEDEIVALMDRFPHTRLVLGVIGGQGVLLGRGNQQLGPRVFCRLSPDDVTIVSSAEKLAALDPPLLRVDVGDDAPYSWADGYRRVRVGPRRYMMMRVAAA